jgi:hypothetical protein
MLFVKPAKKATALSCIHFDSHIYEIIASIRFVFGKLNEKKNCKTSAGYVVVCQSRPFVSKLDGPGRLNG